MKKYFLIIFSLVATILITIPSFCKAAILDQEFILFYSNDVKGETEPCG